MPGHTNADSPSEPQWNSDLPSQRPQGSHAGRLDVAPRRWPSSKHQARPQTQAEGQGEWLSPFQGLCAAATRARPELGSKQLCHAGQGWAPQAAALVDAETPSPSVLAAAAGSRALGGTYTPPRGRWHPKSGIRAQTGANAISDGALCGPRRLKLTKTIPVAVTSLQGAVCFGQPHLGPVPLGTEPAHRCLAAHPAGQGSPSTLTSSGNSSPTRAMIRDVFPTWARKEREEVGTGPAMGASSQRESQPRGNAAGQPAGDGAGRVRALRGAR